MADDRLRGLIRATRGGDVEAAEALLWELLRSGRLLVLKNTGDNTFSGPRESLPWIHNSYVVGGVRLLGWAGWKGAQPLLDEIQNAIVGSRLPDQPTYKRRLGVAAGDMPLRGHGRSGASLRPYTKLGDKIEKEEISPYLGVYAAAQGLKAIDAGRFNALYAADQAPDADELGPLFALATRYIETPSSQTLFPGVPYSDQRVQDHNALLFELSRNVDREARRLTEGFPNIYSHPSLNSYLTTHRDRAGWCHAEAIRDFARAAELLGTANEGGWVDSLFFSAECIAWRCEDPTATAAGSVASHGHRIYRPAWSPTDRYCVNPSRGCAALGNRLVKKSVLDPCLIWHALWCAGEKPPEIVPGAGMTFPGEVP